MPSVLIEVRRPLTQEAERAIMEAVHSALVSAFTIPAEDRSVRLVVHEPHRFAHPPDLTSPDLFMLISLDVFAGRSLDAKRTLYAKIAENLEVLRIPRDHVEIVLREIPRENWGVRGGRAASDVDLGFEVDV